MSAHLRQAWAERIEMGTLVRIAAHKPEEYLPKEGEPPKYTRLGADDHPLGSRHIWINHDGSGEMLSEAYGLKSTTKWKKGEGHVEAARIHDTYDSHARGASLHTEAATWKRHPEGGYQDDRGYRIQNWDREFHAFAPGVHPDVRGGGKRYETAYSNAFTREKSLSEAKSQVERHSVTPFNDTRSVYNKHRTELNEKYRQEEQNKQTGKAT